MTDQDKAKAIKRQCYVSAYFDPRTPEQKKADDLELTKSAEFNYKNINHFTVGMLMKCLSKLDKNLPVCLADWNEGYSSDNNSVTAKISVKEGKFASEDKTCNGIYVVIGS